MKSLNLVNQTRFLCTPLLFSEYLQNKRLVWNLIRDLQNSFKNSEDIYLALQCTYIYKVFSSFVLILRSYLMMFQDYSSLCTWESLLVVLEGPCGTRTPACRALSYGAISFWLCSNLLIFHVGGFMPHQVGSGLTPDSAWRTLCGCWRWKPCLPCARQAHHSLNYLWSLLTFFQLLSFGKWKNP